MDIFIAIKPMNPLQKKKSYKKAWHRLCVKVLRSALFSHWFLPRYLNHCNHQSLTGWAAANGFSTSSILWLVGKWQKPTKTLVFWTLMSKKTCPSSLWHVPLNRDFVKDWYLHGERNDALSGHWTVLSRSEDHPLQHNTPAQARSSCWPDGSGSEKQLSIHQVTYQDTHILISRNV